MIFCILVKLVVNMSATNNTPVHATPHVSYWLLQCRGLVSISIRCKDNCVEIVTDFLQKNPRALSQFKIELPENFLPTNANK